jgi:predicted RNA-binding protein
MCEAAAYVLKDGEEELLLESVDIIEPEGDGLRLVNIFGEQKIIRADIQRLNLVNHKIILVEKGPGSG